MHNPSQISVGFGEESFDVGFDVIEPLGRRLGDFVGREEDSDGESSL